MSYLRSTDERSKLLLNPFYDLQLFKCVYMSVLYTMFTWNYRSTKAKHIWGHQATSNFRHFNLQWTLITRASAFLYRDLVLLMLLLFLLSLRAKLDEIPIEKLIKINGFMNGIMCDHKSTCASSTTHEKRESFYRGGWRVSTNSCEFEHIQKYKKNSRRRRRKNERHTDEPIAHGIRAISH